MALIHYHGFCLHIMWIQILFSIGLFFDLRYVQRKDLQQFLALRGLELNPCGTMGGHELGSMENVQCTSKIP